MKDILIQSHQDAFTNLLYSQNGSRLVAINQDDLLKYCVQYGISAFEGETVQKFPIELPYTQFVVDVNENYKLFIDELYNFVKTLYQDCSIEMEQAASDFLNKINACFISFANFTEVEINLIVCAIISSNIKYCFKSVSFYEDYINKKVNPKNQIKISCERNFKEAWQSFEEVIYEKLKKKLDQFISDITGRQLEFTTLRPKNQESDIINMITYFQSVMIQLGSISKDYISNEFYQAMTFISEIYFNYLFNQSLIREFNIYFIMNLKFDIDLINEFLEEISDSNLSFKGCLTEIYRLIDFFFKKESDYFLKQNAGRGCIQKKHFIPFILKYKNLKGKKEMLPNFITEAEIQAFIKKIGQA